LLDASDGDGDALYVSLSTYTEGAHLWATMACVLLERGQTLAHLASLPGMEPLLVCCYAR